MSKVSKNIVYNGLGQGLSVLLSFVAVRFVFKQLGGDALGLIYFSIAFGTALTVAVQLGICESAVREVAAHHRNQPEYIECFIRTSSLLYWSSYLALTLVVYAASPYLVHRWVRIASLDSFTAIKAMRILSLAALAALPIGLYRSLLVGLQHMGITNLVDVVQKGLQQGGIFLILLLHGSLFHVAYWIVTSTGLQIVVYAFVCARYFPVRSLFLPTFSLAVVKQNFGFASGLVVISLCAWMLTEVDKIVVSKMLPLALLGIYSVTRGAINQGLLLSLAVNNAIYPHFSALHGRGAMTELRSGYDKIQDLTCFATFPVFAAVPFAVIPVFSRLFDARSAHLLLLPATFLCVGYYMNGTLAAPYVVSLAVGRPDIVARQNALALLIVPPVSVVSIYFLGLSGAGLSWVIYHIYTFCYGLPRICRECLGIAPRDWYWHIFRILLTSVPIYGIAWLAVRSIGQFSALHLLIAYLAATLLYFFMAIYLMKPQTRRRILGSFGPWGLKLCEGDIITK